MATTTIDAAGSDPIEILQANGAGTEVLRVTSAGKLGVGTASPTSTLHVVGDAAISNSLSGTVDLVVKNTKTSDSAAGTRLMSYVADGTAGDPKIGLGITGTQDYYLRIDNDDSDKLKLSSNDTDMLTMLVDGKVGIGTASPGAKLHVAGDAKVSSSVSGNVDLLLENTKTSDSAAGTRIMSYVADGTAGDPKIGLGISGVREYYLRIDNDDSDKLKLSSNDVDKVTVLADGKVGVGTSAPDALLQLKCDGSSTDQLRLENSGTNGRVWAISGGLDSAPGDLTIKDQTNGKTVAAFHYHDDDGRFFRVGAYSGTQSGIDCLAVGQSTLCGSGRNGDACILSMDHNSSALSGITLNYRNTADTAAFVGGHIWAGRSGNDTFMTMGTAHNAISNEFMLYMDAHRNFGLNLTGTMGGGAGVIGIGDATTVPTSNPTGGGVLYVSGGHLYFLGTSGSAVRLD